MVANIYPNNGTNFLGANRDVWDPQRLFQSKEETNSIGNFLANTGKHWHFIPAGGAQFGGLWEAAMRSFKQQLYRVDRSLNPSRRCSVWGLMGSCHEVI
ncbi:hypothetical protein QE152_g7927 [Popillia japonica]|uniref:Uncharacterized protein n=1 Tax=Popillia japonica TaxID=7064 RepID=A0AAW1M7W3_POPJA